MSPDEFERMLEEARVNEALAKAGIHRSIKKSNDDYIRDGDDDYLDDDDFIPQTDDGDKYRWMEIWN